MPLAGTPSPPMLFRKPPGLLEPGINVTYPHTPTCLLQGQRHTHTHTPHTHTPLAGTPSLLEPGINVTHHTHPHASCRDSDTHTHTHTPLAGTSSLLEPGINVTHHTRPHASCRGRDTHTPFSGTLSPPMLYGTPDQSFSSAHSVQETPSPS